MPIAVEPGLCSANLGTFSRRESKGSSFSSDPPPGRLSREMPVVCHDDHRNNDPQRGGICVTTDQVGHYRQRWEEDARETHVHEHRYEQALGISFAAFGGHGRFKDLATSRVIHWG
jgi:hypothetical protein